MKTKIKEWRVYVKYQNSGIIHTRTFKQMKRAIDYINITALNQFVEYINLVAIRKDMGNATATSRVYTRNHQ